MNRLLVALIGAGMWTGCGGSESPATTSTESPSADASATEASSTTGTGGTNDAATQVDASTPSEAGIDLDGISFPDGPLGECAACTLSMCSSELAACATNQKCQDGVTCSLTKCAQFYLEADAGAQLVPCLLACFDGDLQTALSASGGVTCALTKCPTCAVLADAGGVGN